MLRQWHVTCHNLAIDNTVVTQMVLVEWVSLREGESGLEPKTFA